MAASRERIGDRLRERLETNGRDTYNSVSSSGTYYLDVSKQEKNDNGNYYLHVYTTDDPKTDASVKPTQEGDPFDKLTHDNNLSDCDWFSIDLSSSSNYIINLEGKSGVLRDDVRSVSGIGGLVRSAYLAESLALQELQTETGAAIRRNVVVTSGPDLRRVEIDALLLGADGATVVETKFIQNPEVYDHLTEVLDKAKNVRKHLMKGDKNFFKYLIILIVNGEQEQVEIINSKIRKITNSLPENVSVRSLWLIPLSQVIRFLWHQPVRRRPDACRRRSFVGGDSAVPASFPSGGSVGR